MYDVAASVSITAAFERGGVSGSQVALLRRTRTFEFVLLGLYDVCVILEGGTDYQCGSGDCLKNSQGRRVLRLQGPRARIWAIF